MMKERLAVVAVALLAFTPTAGAQQAIERRGDAPEIETIGIAQHRAPAERAVVMFSVESRGPAAANAATLNAVAVQSVREALRRMRADTAATTMRYHVGQEYGPPQPMDEGRTPRIIGYLARTTVVARVARIEQLGPAIDAALAAGATGVEGLFFEPANSEVARQAALADAAAAARRDAETLARAMGGSLGPLLSTSTTATPRGYPSDVVVTGGGMAGLQMAETQIVPGEIAVQAVVRARWAFIPGR